MKNYLQNRKARLAAGVTAAVLAFSVASPAMAQVTVAGDDNNAAQFVDASQVQVALGVQRGDANAAANDDSRSYAYNDLSIVQTQFNGGIGDLDLDGISDLNDVDDDNDGLEDVFE